MKLSPIRRRSWLLQDASHSARILEADLSPSEAIPADRARTSCRTSDLIRVRVRSASRVGLTWTLDKSFYWRVANFAHSPVLACMQNLRNSAKRRIHVRSLSSKDPPRRGFEVHDDNWQCWHMISSHGTKNQCLISNLSGKTKLL